MSGKVPTTNSLMTTPKLECLANGLNVKIYNTRFVKYNGVMLSSQVANISVKHAWMALLEQLHGYNKMY